MKVTLSLTLCLYDNHIWWIRSCRQAAAKRHFGELYTTAIPSQQKALIASDEIVVIATLDSDHKLAALKSHNPTKGNISRPVYTWTARANRIGGYMVPDDQGRYRPAIDIITVDGDTMLADTPLASHLSFGKSLVDLGLLDTWIIPDEHVETAKEVSTYAPEALHITQPGTIADERTGRVWSTTYIVQRVTNRLLSAYEPPETSN